MEDDHAHLRYGLASRAAKALALHRRQRSGQVARRACGEA
jgi:hypothetical protein